MAHDLIEAGYGQSVNQFICRKSALACRAPDIDTVRIQNKNPGIQTGQLRAKGVQRQFIVGRYEHRCHSIRLADSIEPGIHRILIAL